MMNRKLMGLALAAVLVLGAGAARAEDTMFCRSKVAYYVLFEPATPPHGTLHEYFDGVFVGGFPALLDGVDHWRAVNERRTEILFQVCIEDVSDFEDRHGIDPGFTEQVDDSPELARVFDSSRNRLGTRWMDLLPPFAEGGGVALQQYHVCLAKGGAPADGGPAAVVSNASATDTGLDRDAIAASEEAKEAEWFAPFRRLLDTITDQRVREEWGPAHCGPPGFGQMLRVSKRDFLGPSEGGHRLRVHYDVYDPRNNVNGEPAI